MDDLRLTDAALTDDLRLVDALLAEDKETTISLLTQSLRANTGNATATTRLLLARARALRELRQPRRAQDDLERAVALLDSGHVMIAPDRVRDAVLGSPLDAFVLLADALDRQGNPARAQEMLERSRTWRRRARSQPPRTRLQPVPSSIVLVRYRLFPDRVVIYVNNRRATVSVTRST